MDVIITNVVVYYKNMDSIRAGLENIFPDGYDTAFSGRVVILFHATGGHAVFNSILQRAVRVC